MSADGSAAGAAMIPFKECTPDICPYERSFYLYRIDIAPNAAFLALFSLSLLAFLGVFIYTRRGATFTIAMILGLISEILGYAGRVMSWKDQWSEPGFLMQICCLTIGPAFLAAGIYFCIRKIVFTFGAENSRIPHEYYTRIFIPCDVVSLILQATGGGLASIASHNQKSTDTGDNIMIAGLAFQVVTLLAFIVLCIDFAINTLLRRRALGDAAFDQNPAIVAVRGSKMFKCFLGALALSTICIFWRCVFRVAELSNGWTGELMGRQDLFVGFEGVMITIAVWVLNIFHPSLCFGVMMGHKHGEGRHTEKSASDLRHDIEASGSEEMRQRNAKHSAATSSSNSQYTSDVERVERV